MVARRWIEREFELGLAPEALSGLIARIRGIPARIEASVLTLPRETLTRRLRGTWSIQENVGHLLDLEPLGDERLTQFLAGAKTLVPADMSNRRTEEARHNEAGIEQLTTEFRRQRLAFVARLEALDPDDVLRVALHPRLERPMAVTDLVFFIAEHDDHHLARIREIVEELGNERGNEPTDVG